MAGMDGTAVDVQSIMLNAAFGAGGPDAISYLDLARVLAKLYNCPCPGRFPSGATYRAIVVICCHHNFVRETVLLCSRFFLQ